MLTESRVSKYDETISRINTPPLDAVIAGYLPGAVSASSLMEVASRVAGEEELPRYERIAAFTTEISQHLRQRGITRSPFFTQLVAAYELTSQWQDQGARVCGLFDDTGMGKTFTTYLAYLGWQQAHPESRLILLADNKPLQRAQQELIDAGLRKEDVYCWSDPEWSALSSGTKTFHLNRFSGPILLLNYDAMKEETIRDAIDTGGIGEHVVAVDEAHKVRRQITGNVAKRTNNIWDFSTTMNNRGGRGLLITSTPIVHTSQELHDWTIAWKTKNLPVISRPKEQYFKMPPLSATAVEVRTNLDEVTQMESDSAGKYFRDELIAEASAIYSWFVNSHLPQVLQDPQRRVVAFTPFVYENRVTGDISLIQLARVLRERGIKCEMMYGNASSAPESIRHFLAEGQVMLASYASGSESFTLNAPGIKAEAVLLLPPPFAHQYYQAISRIHRPIGTGEEEVTVVTPRVVREEGLSLTERLYAVLARADRKGAQTMGRTSLWDKVAGSLAGQAKIAVVDSLLAQSNTPLIPRYGSRRVSREKPAEALFTLPAPVKDDDMLELYHQYEEAKAEDQKTPSSANLKSAEIFKQIYEGVLTRVWTLVTNEASMLGREDLTHDVFQEVSIQVADILTSFSVSGKEDFSNFLRRKVKEITQRTLVRERKWGQVESLDAPVNPGSNTSLIDRLATQAGTADTARQAMGTIARDKLLQAMKDSEQFTDTHIAIFRAFFLSGATLFASGSREKMRLMAELGISQQSLNHKWDQVVRWLRQSKFRPILEDLWLVADNIQTSPVHVEHLTERDAMAKIVGRMQKFPEWITEENNFIPLSASMEKIFASAYEVLAKHGYEYKFAANIEKKPRNWDELTQLVSFILTGYEEIYGNDIQNHTGHLQINKNALRIASAGLKAIRELSYSADPSRVLKKLEEEINDQIDEIRGVIIRNPEH